MINDKNKKALKAMLLKGAALPLRAMPLWLEAIGAGAVMAAVVEKNPGFKARLGGLDGKVFLFEAKDLNKRFYLRIKDMEIACVPHVPGEPDVRMRGDFAVLLDLLLGKADPDTVFFSRRLEITGDTAAAIHFKNILAALG
ncbi:MAG: SCP2 sterol-binding domain-containing protein [Deltaproteobacteria bacterium]|nr:SCP2 sterol-binding domain-containing protein [Deltaproteobacteria bacterium]